VVESGTLAELRHLTRTSIRAELARPAPGIADLDGVHNVVAEGGRVELEVDTEQLGTVLARLGDSQILTLTSQPPTLEELFLRQYGDTVVAESAEVLEGAGR
jgi:ABC-2 type transport system ATP-binding protein